MEANLQIKTYNRHNIPKNDYINKLNNPHVNRISKDITYKRKSIVNTERNPVHINGGAEYLYNKRIEELKRKLQRREITLMQYKNEIRSVQIARFGRVIEEPIIQPVHRTNTNIINNTNDNINNDTNDNDTDEKTNESIDKEDDETKPEEPVYVEPKNEKELLNIINKTDE